MMDAAPSKPTEPACSVAAVQMCSGNDRDANLASAGRLLALAAERGARLALLPENFSLMAQRDAERRAHAEADAAGPVQEFLARTANRLGMWIIAGSVPIRQAGGERNAQACLTCTAKPCAGACPHGLAIDTLTAPTHRLLS